MAESSGLVGQTSEFSISHTQSFKCVCYQMMLSATNTMKY